MSPVIDSDYMLASYFRLELLYIMERLSINLLLYASSIF